MQRRISVCFATPCITYIYSDLGDLALDGRVFIGPHRHHLYEGGFPSDHITTQNDNAES